MTVEQSMKIHGELVKLRDEGITKFLGLSAHSYFDKALALISTGGFDQCMLSYGYMPRGYNQVFSPRMLELRNACMAKAHELGMGNPSIAIRNGSYSMVAYRDYEFPRDREAIAEVEKEIEAVLRKANSPELVPWG